MTSAPPHPPRSPGRVLARWRAQALPLAVLLIGLLATAWVTRAQYQDVQAAQHRHFESHVAHIVDDARRSLTRPLDLLLSVRAALVTARGVALESELQAYATARGVAGDHPGLLGIGLIERRAEAGPPRYRLLAVEPASSLAAFTGGDLRDTLPAEAPLNEAIERALSSGDAVLSGALQLGVEGQREPGFMLLLPVRDGVLLAAPLSATQVFRGVVDAADRRLDFEVFDGGTAVFDHDGHLQPGDVTSQYADRLFAASRRLQVASRVLTLRTSTTPEFEAAYGSATPRITAAAGTALTLLGTLLVALLGAARVRATARAQALSENLELLAKVAKHTSNAVVVTDADQRIRWVNEGFERLSGYSAAEAVGHRAGELLRPADPDPGLAARLRETLGNGQPLRAEMAARAKDGHEYWIDNDIQPLHDAQGVLTGFMAVHTDITAAHAATQALARERERLALVLAGSNAGTWEWDMAGDPAVDERFAALLGRDAGQMREVLALPNGIQSILHPDDRDAAVAALRSHLSGQSPAFDQEMRLCHLDGRWLWLLVRGQVTVRDDEGRPRRMSGTLADVTDKREAARRWRARAEMSGDWFWVTDAQHRFVEVFAAVAQRRVIGGGSMIGQRRDEVPFVDPPEEGWAAFHARLDRHEVIKAVAYRTRFDANNPRWLELDGRPRFDDAGRFLGYEGVGRDITERRRVTQDLRDSLALIDSLFEAIPTPVVIKDTQGRYLRTNRALAELYGVPAAGGLSEPSPLAGRRNQDLQDAEAAAVHQRVDEQLLAQPGRAVYEVHQRLVGGREFDSLIHKATLLDGDGRVTGLVSVTVDITEQRRQAQALRDARDAAESANRAKSAFLATMSHEIRTPMNGVVAMAELLALSQLDPDQAQTVATIRQSALALLRILDDILDFSKIEAGRLELEHDPLAVAPLVQGVCAALSGVASARGVHLRWSVDDDVPPHVRGDATRLRQLLNNLVGNAVKFSSGLARGGNVSVRVRRDEPGLAFEITDNGIGMDSATLARLFTPFTQAEVSTTRRYGGTGLGLAISRRLVDLMGGRIEVESRPGEGATFTARLPLTACAAPARDPEAPAAPERNTPDGARILVAEDDPVNRLVIKRQLELLGHVAEVVDNGRQALALWTDAAQAPFGLVITDLHMPEMDGYSLVAAIRQHEGDHRHPAVPILALTANAMEGEAQRARQAGMDDYLTKPLALAQLKAALAKWLGR